MKHVMIDCYCTNNYKLDDLMYINDLLNKLADWANLKTVAPPVMIPYYYCKDERDVGISAYLFLNGGHITIHTFSRRQCYFVDVMYDGNFDAEGIYDFLHSNLTFEKSISNLCINDRRVTNNLRGNVTDTDFGPHLVGRIIPNCEISLDKMFDILEQLVYVADMTPISRPNVIKNNINNYTWLQGIIVIAQSHISLYYDTENHILYFDLFSCSYFDFSQMESTISRLLGIPESLQLVKRGDKFALSFDEVNELSVAGISAQWQKNIKH